MIKYFRLVSMIVLAFFIPACAQYETREITKSEFQSVKVDWDALGLETLDVGGIRTRGMLITPAQWPLEASFKSLVDGDFKGVIEAFDLRFHYSDIPEGVLEELFDEGYLPAYIRVENPHPEPRTFLASRLGARLDSTSFLRPVNPEDLPARYRELNWEYTTKKSLLVGLNVVVIVSILALCGAAGGGCNGMGLPDFGFQKEFGDAKVHSKSLDVAEKEWGTKFLLWKTRLLPGEAREGLVFFRLRLKGYEWPSARLVGF